MKYSICGDLMTLDGTPVINTINGYAIWKLISNQADSFSFEVWVNSINDKDGLYAQLKPYVDSYTGQINWHECTHDEEFPMPCSLSESYVR